jgi:predicted enzyme related to lactoylglutathione lyase
VLDSGGGEEWNAAMSIRTSPWPAGVPCWADLTVPDIEAAKAFYGAVLGWSFQGSGEEYGGYVIAQVRDHATAGIGPLQGEAPPAWTLYLASDDADSTATAVTGHGGTVLLPPGDVGPMGRMFIAADPAGAVFGVWQAGEHIGASLTNEPGGLTWEDLRSTDPDRARAFYSAVFGYHTTAMAEAGPDYRTFALAEGHPPLGGMGGMMGMDGAPSFWLVYFAVRDAAAACAAAEARGGTVQMRDLDTPFGTMAGLADPAGAMFWIVESDGTNPQPDR